MEVSRRERKRPKQRLCRNENNAHDMFFCIERSSWLALLVNVPDAQDS